MIYFTGDQHFGHANIIKHCNRPFSSIDEMDKSLLEKWNKRVKRMTWFISSEIYSSEMLSHAKNICKA